MPARKKRMPANRIVDGTLRTGRISSYPILINGVALPQSAQHRSAAKVTKYGLVNSLFDLLCNLKYLFSLCSQVLYRKSPEKSSVIAALTKIKRCAAIKELRNKHKGVALTVAVASSIFRGGTYSFYSASSE